MHQNFKGQLENEVVISNFRHHWITVLPRLLAIFGCLVALTVILGNLPQLLFNENLAQDGAFKFGVIAGGVALMLFMHRQFLAIFQYFLTTVIVTNFRVVEVDKSLYFRDSKDSLDLSKIQDIQKSQNGILESLLNFGRLTVVLSGTHASVNIDLVPRPDYHFKVINHAKRTYIERRKQYQSSFENEEALVKTLVGEQQSQYNRTLQEYHD